MSRVLVASPDLRPSLLPVLDALVEAGELLRLVTLKLFDPSHALDRMWLRLLPAGRTAHRRVPDWLAGRVDSIVPAELLRVLLGRLHPYLGHRLWLGNELAFDRRVARDYAGRASVLVGTEHACLESFRAQHRCGGTTVLRQVIAHAEDCDAVYAAQAAAGADQVPPLRPWQREDLVRSRARKCAEYEAADWILANSDFVRDSFIAHGYPRERIVSIPTACPAPPLASARAGRGPGPLRFVTVGTPGYRKGTDILLEAWRRAGLTDAELVLIGTPATADWARAIAASGARCLGRLAPEAVTRALLESDVFVLPSRLEGLAHSALEALAAGLPMIVTAAVGLGSWVDAENGWRLLDLDPDRLAQCLSAAAADRSRLARMGEVSRTRACAWGVREASAATRHFFQRVLRSCVDS